MRVLLCHNPTAGNKGGHDKDSIMAALKLADHDARYISVKDEKFLAAFEKEADLIVAAGGDGTLAHVLTNIPDRAVPIAILPLGTANNFARSLGIAGTPQELVEMWDIERHCPVSLGSVTGHWGTSLFLEGYGIGVFPDFLQAASKEKKPEGADNLRKGRHWLQKALKKAEPVDLTIKIGDKTQEKTVLGIEVCNIAFTGPGLPIAATADLSDDKLDVVIFEVDQRHAMIDWVGKPLDEKPPVTNRKVERIDITFSGAATRVDDEAFGAGNKEQTVEIVCEETPVRVLIPVKHPTQKKPEKAADAA
jgi:diacylglycerol kinase family enzyme